MRGVTRKFEVKFSAHTDLAPSFVYVFPSQAYRGHFAVAILYRTSMSGGFKSLIGIARTFGFEQNLCKKEFEAIQ